MNKNIKIIAIILILIGIALLAISLLQPQPGIQHPTPQPIKPRTKSTTSEVTTLYTGTNLKVPKTLPSYQGVMKSSREYARELAATNDLTPHPNSDNIWHNPEVGMSISLRSDIEAIKITTPFQEPSATGIIPESLADQVISSFNKLDSSDIQVINHAIQFLNTQPEPSNTSPSSAGQAKVPFHRTLNNYPLIVENQTFTDQNAWITSEGLVYKITTSPPIRITQELGIIDLISVKRAVENIRTGNSVITRTAPHAQQLILEVEDLTSINLTQARLEYRFNPSDNTIYPYYNFFGTANSLNNKYTIEVITPAFE